MTTNEPGVCSSQPVMTLRRRSDGKSARTAWRTAPFTDPDAVLDLPAAFDRCYEVGGYDLLVNYAKAPPVALSESESAWLRNLLTEQSAI